MIDLAAISFGGAAGAAVSLEDPDVEAFDGWTLIDQALGCTRRADSFVDQFDHSNDALPLGDSSFDTVTNLH